VTSAVETMRRWFVRDRPESAPHRRVTDVIRIGVAVGLLTLLALHADHPTRPERAVATFFHTLPDGAADVLRGAYSIVSLWALLLVVAALVLLRGWRLARDVLVAGTVTWLLGRGLAYLVRQTDLAHAFSLAFTGQATPRFPLVRVAVAVSAIAVAGPYLARPVRRVGQGLVLLLALTAMYLGRGLPTDLLGALVLGWGVAAGVHLAFGTPVGRPTVRQVGEALAALRIEASNVRMAPDQPIGRAIFLASSGEHDLRVVAIGRDEADTQFLARLSRYLAFRDSPPAPLPTRRQQVEYEGFVMLTAQQAHVRVPNVLAAAAPIGPVAVLVEQLPAGALLGALAPSAVTDELLDDCWGQLRRLHAARIAHGCLDADHVLTDHGQVTLVGWQRAATSAEPAQLHRDTAQLLAATAGVVGIRRGVDAAARNLGRADLSAALPFLQPPALSRGTRETLARDGGKETTLDDLREATAARAGTEVPELHELYRVSPRTLIMATSGVIAVAVLLSRVGNPVTFWDSIRGANWLYLLLAVVLGLLADAAFAIAFLGSVPIRLPLWSTLELQASMEYTNLAIPVAGDTAIQVRYLQKSGLDLTSAVATGGLLSTVVENACKLGLFFLAVALAPTAIHLGHINTGQVVVSVLAVLFLGAIAVGVVFAVRRLRHAVLPRVAGAGRAVWATVKTPTRIGLMVGGNVVAQLLYAGSLLASLSAFGTPVSFWSLLAIDIGVSLVASLVPIPGGGTAVSAIGLSGLLITFGVPHGAAVAAVLSHELAVTYVPAIPGFFATNDLVRRGLL
jgi:glycosyltransferase 2 family protein